MRAILIMIRYFSQDIQITRWVKQDHAKYCGLYYRMNDRIQFCRHYFFALLSRGNRVICEECITAAIHKLTKWSAESIKKTIQRVIETGEFHRYHGYKGIQYNPYFGNRLSYNDKRVLYYDGEEYAPAGGEQEVIRAVRTQMKLVVDEEVVAEEYELPQIVNLEEHMQLKQEVEALREDNIEIKAMLREMMNTLKEYAPQQAEKYERHLKVVKNDD
jgi:hypothetical protein